MPSVVNVVKVANVANLLILGLATWRLTHMLMWERGPYNILVKFREFTGITHDDEFAPNSYPDNHVLSCAYCTSIWCALIMLVSPEWVRKVLAVSTVSIMVDRWLEAT